MPANFLAIDIGASSGRAVLAKLTDNKLYTQEIHRFNNQPVNLLGHIYWNIFSLYEQIKTAMAKCAQDFTPQLEGVGIDTWGVDFGLVARDNSIVGLPCAYRDSRTNGMLEAAFQRMPREKLYERTGIQFLQFNSVFQLLAMVLEKSPLLKVADKLLFMPDLLNFLFSGEKVSEFSITSTSQLYNPLTKDWDQSVFEALGLPLEIMPKIIKTGTELGNLLPAVLQETGLAPVKIIATACHDTGAAVAAVPASGSDWAYLSSGTWSLMGLEIREPIINAKSLAYNFTNEGGVDGSIRFLKNIAGLWLVQECRRIWQREGKDFDFGQLTQMAANARGFIGIIDPDDPSFLLPENMPATIIQYLKQTRQPIPQTEGEIIRVVLESLALKYRYTLEQINELRGAPVLKLHIVGGGTKNELLNQFTANACGIPVIAGPTEATAIGNVIVQAVTRGILPSIEDARAVIRNSFELKAYQPRNAEQWEARFEAYKNLVA
jgi:rhamnulokinase